MEMYLLRRIRPELSADKEGLVPTELFMEKRAELADPLV